MNPAPDPDKEEKSRVGGWLMAVMVCLVLYVLSIGPVVAIFDKLKLQPNKSLQWFYKPLIHLHDHTALKKPLERYVELWTR